MTTTPTSNYGIVPDGFQIVVRYPNAVDAAAAAARLAKKNGRALFAVVLDDDDRCGDFQYVVVAPEGWYDLVHPAAA